MIAQQINAATPTDPGGNSIAGRCQLQGVDDVNPDGASWAWNEHRNDIGDFCGHSDEVAEIAVDGLSDARCPGGCRASQAIDPTDEA